MNSWDLYFMSLLDPVAVKSRDRSRKVGAIIVGEDNEIRSTGFNGFPRGVNDNVPERYDRPEKYFWTEHAERNAIYNAARHGVRIKGCTIYSSLFPCMDCARGIIQSGIDMVVAPSPNYEDATYAEQFRHAVVAFAEADIIVKSAA